MPRRPVTDPTAVVARRGGAWFINTVLCALAGAIPALLLADAYELNRASDGFDVERHGDDIAFFLRDTVVVLSRAELAVTAGAFAVGVLLVLVLLPAWKGWSPGHLAADLRIVRRDGRRVGVGGAIVRTLGWIVDILPGIPLVAYTSARVTRHHQRVGDRLARTYVVDKRAAGRPVDQPLTDDAPEAMTVEEPEQESVLFAPREPEPDLEAEPEPEPVPESMPEPEPEPEPGPVPAPVVAAPPEGVPVDEPIWDRRHRRYVLWHSKAGRWLTHTDAGWAPFERAGTEDASPDG